MGWTKTAAGVFSESSLPTFRRFSLKRVAHLEVTGKVPSITSATLMPSDDDPRNTTGFVVIPPPSPLRWEPG